MRFPQVNLSMTLKGHFANIINETLHLVIGQSLAQMNIIKNTTITKDAL